MRAIINGIVYPVEVKSIDKVTWLAKVDVLNAEPFPRHTHGGTAYYSNGYVTISNLRTDEGDVVQLERMRLESKESGG
jgi:hypothetical protein